MARFTGKSLEFLEKNQILIFLNEFQRYDFPVPGAFCVAIYFEPGHIPTKVGLFVCCLVVWDHTKVLKPVFFALTSAIAECLGTSEASSSVRKS